MRRLQRLSAFAIASAVLLAFGLDAAAEEPPEPMLTGLVEAGAYWSSDDSYDFGEHTGFGEDEWNLLSNFELRARPPWDSGKAWSFRAIGVNLGLDSRHIEARGGIQGRFDLHASWDQIPHLFADDLELAFRGRGTDRLTLPDDWIAAPTTLGFGALEESLSTLRLRRDRRDLRVGSDTVLPRGFELSTRYRYDRQTGRKAVGSVIGNTGGNPRAVIIPQPVDWKTHDGDIALRWASDIAQAEVGYEISHFDDEEDALTWQNPFSAIRDWDPAAGYPSGFGRRGRPPDNEFHQVKASGGYDLPFETRVMAHAAFGWMRQNDDFSGYTVNDALIVTTPLPRDDADAEIKTRNAGVRLTSRPLEPLRLTAEWRYDDRDNDTPRDTFIYVPGDSLDQSTIDSNRARRNLPQSYRSNDWRVEAGYEVIERTEVLASYRYQRIDRSWTEAEEVEERTTRAGVHSRPFRGVDVRVDGAWSSRKGGDYFYNAPLVWGFSPEHVATLDLELDFENHPLLRKYTLADRDRKEVDARATWMPCDGVTLGGHFGFAYEDYENSDLGLEKRRGMTWGLDASWAPLEALMLYAYYTSESFDSRQKGRSFSNPVQAMDPTRDWWQSDEDDVDTVGGGFEWVAIADRLTLRADAAWSRARDRIDVEKGIGLLPPAESFPVDHSRLLDVSVQAELQVIERVKLRAGWLFESFEADDWALDGVEPNTIPEVLTLGGKTPSYNAHLVGFSVEYGF